MLKKTVVDSGRVWSGPGRGLRLQGPDSARVYLGLYEIELNRWIKQLITPGCSVFDVGAQFGYDALLFARLGAAKVVTVEADPRLLSVMVANIEMNRESGRVISEIALIGDGSGGSLTLDALATKHYWPDFVKMDIEGAEGAAMHGADGVLQHATAWIVEVHGLDQEHECRLRLIESGYRVTVVMPRRWLPDHRPMAHNRWLVARR